MNSIDNQLLNSQEIKILSSQLTILFLCKNRFEFSERWLSYMSDNDCPCKIIIADSSSDDSLCTFLEKGYNVNLNYQYIKYPSNEKNNEVYLLKKYESLMKATTDYVLFADDDDFYLLKNLAMCINYLNLHNDYVACGGNTVFFELYNRQGLSVNSSYGDRYNAYLNLSHSISDDSGLNRMLTYLRFADTFNFYMLNYHVYRTSDLKVVINRLRSYHFNDPVAYELLLTMLMLEIGKIKTIKYPHYIRQTGSSTLTHNLNLNNNLIERFVLEGTVCFFVDTLKKEMDKYNSNDVELIIKEFSFWFSGQAIGIYNVSYLKRIFMKFSQFRTDSPIYNQTVNKLYMIYLLLFNKRIGRIFVNLDTISKYILR